MIKPHPFFVFTRFVRSSLSFLEAKRDDQRWKNLSFFFPFRAWKSVMMIVRVLLLFRSSSFSFLWSMAINRNKDSSRRESLKIDDRFFLWDFSSSGSATTAAAKNDDDDSSAFVIGAAMTNDNLQISLLFPLPLMMTYQRKWCIGLWWCVLKPKKPVPSRWTWRKTLSSFSFVRLLPMEIDRTHDDNKTWRIDKEERKKKEEGNRLLLVLQERQQSKSISLITACYS